MPSNVAIASAATPWCVCGCRARSRSLPASISGPRTFICASPSAGCSDIISQPPAMTTSSNPDMIDAAAKLVVVMPEPQKRSRVTPEAFVSNPASSSAILARSPPCVPTCMLVPKMTSSTAAVSTSLRSRMALSTVAPSCCGWMSARAPLPTLPTPRGVRHASMIQASFMYIHLREATKRLSSSEGSRYVAGGACRQPAGPAARPDHHGLCHVGSCDSIHRVREDEVERVLAVVDAERARTVRQIESLRRSVASIVEAAELTATDDEHDPEGATIAYERAQA